jgi:GNAT superfamily N-acetyltransferase
LTDHNPRLQLGAHEWPAFLVDFHRAGLINSAEYPLRSLTQNLVRHPEASVDEALRAQVIASRDAALPAGLPARVATLLGVLLRASDGRLIGALTGYTRWDWLSIELLWIEAAARRGGQGRRLLAAAEQEALRRGCRQVRVDTYSWIPPSTAFPARLGSLGSA